MIIRLLLIGLLTVSVTAQAVQQAGLTLAGLLKVPVPEVVHCSEV